MGTGQIWSSKKCALDMCSKKYFTKRKAHNLFMSSIGGQKENEEKKKKKLVTQEKLVPQFKIKCLLQKYK